MKKKTQKLTVGQTTILHEADGDFNPAWLVFLVLVLAALAILAVGILGVHQGRLGSDVFIASLSFVASALFLSAYLGIGLEKAKPLAKGVGDAISSIASVGAGAASPFAIHLGGDNPAIDDERDESDLT